MALFCFPLQNYYAKLTKPVISSKKMMFFCKKYQKLFLTTIIDNYFIETRIRLQRRLQKYLRI